MGGAGTALEYDPALLWLNPAATARVTQPALTLAGQTGFAGGLTGSGTLVRPVSDGAFALGAMYRDAGDVMLIASDDTARNVSAARDLLFLAGFGWKMAPVLAAGFDFKWLRSELAEEFRASGVVMDFGIQVQHTAALKTGVALKNIGPGMRYSEDRIGLPSAARIGAAYGRQFGTLLPVFGGGSDRFVAVSDAEYQLEGRRYFWRGGAEYWWLGMLALRAGMQRGSAATLGGVSAGGGIRLDQGETSGVQSYRLDYGVRLLTEGFDPPQTFSLTMTF